MKFFILVLALISSIFAAEMNYAKQKPTIENPRKVVMQLSSADEKSITMALNNISNVLSAYSPEYLNLKVVVYGDGLSLLYKNNNKFKERISQMMDVGVDFIACERTMQTKNIKPADLIQDISYAKTGIAEIIEREADGYIYIKL